MHLLFAIGISVLGGVLVLSFVWGVPNAAERLGIAFVIYARNMRRRQNERTRRQQEQLAYYSREIA